MSEKEATTREICKSCGCESAVGFAVPNETWAAVNFDGVLCLACFTATADELGLEWDRDIRFYPVSLVTLRAKVPLDDLRPLADALAKGHP